MWWENQHRHLLKIDKTEGTVLFKVLSLFEYFDLKYSLFCFLVLDAVPKR